MICRRMKNMYKWCHASRKKYPFVNLKATNISKWCVFVLVTWPRRLQEEWPGACSRLTVVGAGTMHGFVTDPIRKCDWWRAGIRSTNLHIVVESIIRDLSWTFYENPFTRFSVIIFTDKQTYKETNQQRWKHNLRRSWEVTIALEGVIPFDNRTIIDKIYARCTQYSNITCSHILIFIVLLPCLS